MGTGEMICSRMELATSALLRTSCCIHADHSRGVLNQESKGGHCNFWFRPIDRLYRFLLFPIANSSAYTEIKERDPCLSALGESQIDAIRAVM